MRPIGPVLVAGADQHQGLAVIRGLGQAGIPVIAAGTGHWNLGFASRYAAVTRTYRSPFVDPAGCREDLLAMIRELRPAVVIPAVEATLILLNEARTQLPRGTRLAAPPAEVLEFALDKLRTLELARQCGVPAPRTATGVDIPAVLAAAARFSLPLAIKPRGHSLHATTANTLGFKSRYARSFEELRTMLGPFRDDGRKLLVQEYVPGVGRCVSAVCDRGTPVALFAYARDREVPVTGGVSVLRRSIALDPTLRRYTCTLLGAIGWHGIAMVEFKYDPVRDRYTLMEINGRFQASTALSLDAGLNLPHLVAALFSGAALPDVLPYRLGVEERWLRGDLLALAGVWRDGGAPAAHGARTGRWAATWRFVRDFRPGMHYDEFKWDDWRPGLVELGDFARVAVEWFAGRALRLLRRIVPSFPLRRVASTLTQRSVRA